MAYSVRTYRSKKKKKTKTKIDIPERELVIYTVILRKQNKEKGKIIYLKDCFGESDNERNFTSYHFFNFRIKELNTKT